MTVHKIAVYSRDSRTEMLTVVQVGTNFQFSNRTRQFPNWRTVRICTITHHRGRGSLVCDYEPSFILWYFTITNKTIRLNTVITCRYQVSNINWSNRCIARSSCLSDHPIISMMILTSLRIYTCFQFLCLDDSTIFLMIEPISRHIHCDGWWLYVRATSVHCSVNNGTFFGPH